MGRNGHNKRARLYALRLIYLLCYFNLILGYERMSKILSDEIKELTANCNWQSKACYSLAEHAGNLADERMKEIVDDALKFVRNELDTAYKVQKIIVAAGLLDEDKFKEAYDIITNT